MDMTTNDIIVQAINAFRNETKLMAELVTDFLDGPGDPDAIIRLIHDDLEYEFEVEIKKTINRATIGMMANHQPNHIGKPLFVTRYVNPRLAEFMKQMDVMFMDGVGNAYLNVPPLYVYIKGNKPDQKLRPEPLNRIFRPAGLKVLFTLLCNPLMVTKPFREIAEAAGVALGTVGWVMNDLKRMGYLIDMGKRGRRLTKKEDLLNRWVTTYPEQLRPKLIAGRYTAAENEWWKKTIIQDFKALWGGETAAAILTGYLKPEITTIYTKQPIGRLAQKNRFKKDNNGNIEVIDAFWNFDIYPKQGDLVHPLLIYTDLMATADTRNVKTATMIYENELARYLREN